MITDAEKIVSNVVEWPELELALNNARSLTAREIHREETGDPIAYRYSLRDGTSIVFEVSNDTWGYGIHSDLVQAAQEKLNEFFANTDETPPNARFVIPNNYSALEDFHQHTGIVVPENLREREGQGAQRQQTDELER